MRKHIRIIALLIAVLLAFGLAACGGGNSSESADGSASEPEAGTESEATSENPSGETEKAGTQTDKDVLVVYFSMTGTTRGVAEKIAAVTDADIYEIKAAQEYTSDDLDYDNSDSRTTHEQNDPSARPEIGSDPVSLDGYSTVYIGYPIWWGQEPRIMDTFVESQDFDGITVVPFCTSGSSGIGSSGQNLADNAGSGSWLEGQRFDGNVTEDELKAWIDGLSE